MRLAIAAIAALLLIQPASAGWRWTAWGATIPEIQKAYPGDPPGDGGTPLTAETIAAKRFVIEIEGINVGVRMNYNEAGRLTSVGEEPVDSADCAAFLAYLSGYYDSDGFAGARTKFDDAEQSNTITISAEKPDDCSVRYGKLSGS